MTLKIGRVGLDTATLDNPESVAGRSSPTDRSLSITGQAAADTLTTTQVLRDELQAQTALNELAAVAWTEDSRIDGFYRLTGGSFDIRSLVDGGVISFGIDAVRLGGDGELVFRSKIIGTAAQNDHGITEAEAAPFHAPPRGHYAYNPGATFPSTVTRTGSGGAITVYSDVDFSVDPWWSVTPANFYNAAAQLKVSGHLRAGISTPNDPADWELSNELVRVTPNATGGRIDVEHHDGTQWDTAKTWRIQSGGADVGAWDAVAVLRNSPEECAIRLTRNITAGGEITLDLSLRRGSRFVAGYLTRHAAATLKVVLASAEAGQTVTPAGASSAVAIERSTNDGDGNRYVVGSARSFTNDLTNGGLSKASTTTLDFFVGSEIGGSGAQAGDTSEDLSLQYLGVVAEHTVGAAR